MKRGGDDQPGCACFLSLDIFSLVQFIPTYDSESLHAASTRMTFDSKSEPTPNCSSWFAARDDDPGKTLKLLAQMLVATTI